MGPLIALAIKAGLGIGSSLLGSKLSKSKPTPAESTVLSQDAEAQRVGIDTSKNLFSMGGPAVQQPVNYWASILSGNRGAVTSAAAPEINRIGEGYKTATNTSTALNPRGGPSAEFNAELPYAQQRDVTTLLQGARPEAAKSLATTGSNILNSATQSLYASTTAGRDILDREREQKRLEAERGKSIGTGLYDLIQKFGYPAIDAMIKKSGSNSGTERLGV